MFRTTIAPPLSAYFITMSVLSRKVFSALASAYKMLLYDIGLDLCVKMSVVITLIKVSKVDFPTEGVQPVEVLNGSISDVSESLKQCFNLRRLLNNSVSL